MLKNSAKPTSFYEDYRKTIPPVLLHRELEQRHLDTAYLSQLEEHNLGLLPYVRNYRNETFIFESYKLTNRMCEDIGQVLSEKTTLKNLYLINNELKDDSAALLLNRILEKQPLLSLRYVQNEIGTELTQVLIKDIFYMEDGIKEVTLDSCSIKQVLLEQIIESYLVRKVRLRNLGLSNLKINVKVTELVTQLITDSEYLQSLDISWNMLRASDISNLTSSLKYSTNLRYLNLSWNNLSDETGENAKHLRNFLLLQWTILHVDFSFMGLSETEVLTIIDGVKWSHSLIGIHLTGNQISAEKIESINEFLIKDIAFGEALLGDPDIRDLEATTSKNIKLGVWSMFSLWNTLRLICDI